ncbi:MAG: OpgC domain-containing protein, partial [Pseudomonadota bacterium]
MNPTTVPPKAPAKKPRDLRLDFFRGLGMFIIFTAHIPGNVWMMWIPARFGASDATEIFVFCSGMASAIAFGAVFRDRSWWLGTARSAFRVWQVYWAHIAMFLLIAAMLVVFDQLNGEVFYTQRLYIRPFFDDTASHLVALMTLHYVPNYFDILPMYLVLLAMMPIIAGLGLKNRWYAFALMAAMWLVAQFDLIQFSAEIREGVDREWFFNPFGWQLVFFTGFAFMMGWLPAPPFKWWLVALSIAVLALNFVFASRFFWPDHEWIFNFRDATWPLFEKTDQGLFRFTHFLALAYLCYVAAGEGGRRLAGSGLWGGFVAVVRKVGQQSLAIFLTGMVLAQAAGALLDVSGRTALTVAAVNLGGYLFLVGTAYVTAWFKAQPWRRPPQARTAGDALPAAE